MSISEMIQNWKEKREERKRIDVKERARELFQIREYNGQLWFTYNGSLFCPCSLMGDVENGVNILEKIRNLYIERNL